MGGVVDTPSDKLYTAENNTLIFQARTRRNRDEPSGD